MPSHITDRLSTVRRYREVLQRGKSAWYIGWYTHVHSDQSAEWTVSMEMTSYGPKVSSQIMTNTGHLDIETYILVKMIIWFAYLL